MLYFFLPLYAFFSMDVLWILFVLGLLGFADMCKNRTKLGIGLFCAGNSPVTGEFPSQRPVTRIFDVFFDQRLNKRFSKRSWRRWFEAQWHSLWRRCNVTDASQLIHLLLESVCKQRLSSHEWALHAGTWWCHQMKKNPRYWPFVWGIHLVIWDDIAIIMMPL